MAFKHFCETKLPENEDFCSSLRDERVNDKDSQHAQKVWSEFEMETVGDYHRLHSRADVSLLVDVFEELKKREMCT